MTKEIPERKVVCPGCGFKQELVDIITITYDHDWQVKCENCKFSWVEHRNPHYHPKIWLPIGWENENERT